MGEGLGWGFLPLGRRTPTPKPFPNREGSLGPDYCASCSNAVGASGYWTFILQTSRLPDGIGAWAIIGAVGQHFGIGGQGESAFRIGQAAAVPQSRQSPVSCVLPPHIVQSPPRWKR